MTSSRKNARKQQEFCSSEKNDEKLMDFKEKLNQQQNILKKHSEFLLNLNEGINKKIDEAIKNQVNEKLELLNKKISDIIKKLSEHFDKKIELVKQENKGNFIKLKSEMNAVLDSFAINITDTKVKKSFDLFSDDLFNSDLSDNMLGRDKLILDKYKNEIKMDILNDLYMTELKKRKNEELNSLLRKDAFRQGNSNTINRLDFEFNRKLSRNKKTIIKQKILDSIGNKKITLPELKEDIVDFNNYCSKATFYRYFNELKSKNLINYKQQGDEKYVTTVNVLEQYEKKNK